MKLKELRVEAKITTKGKISKGKIVVNGKKYHKVIPAVLFTPSESQSILDIVEKVEKDTNANIVYSK
ncbi:hypothetical protein PG911_13745 [Tenacibaculum ovolyticum]|uniref:hypothetical protein n=1 Tax=Tenacibaculum ovolyticum TaxID=104270 RepID=UPI0022F3AC31|nr:hypothetical protein [Tenacibaculum ovolyticum]WBX75712.1 hypothetical protein PG911_13745 [Tenacibaculum ovolyticum]